MSMDELSSGDSGSHPTSVLLDRARDGDRSAEEVLFRRYRPIVDRLARRLLPERARSPAFDADDLVQETLAAAYQRLHEYREDSRFLYWIERILERRFARPLESADAPAAPSRSTPSAGLRGREEQARIAEAMSCLSEEDRDVLALRYERGLSNEEIAERLEISGDTARKRLSRARARLGVVLGELGNG
jgi:RNA polymerase sigma-70 factor (ECF subfamily)